MLAFTAIDSSKIEPQDHRAAPAQGAGRPVHDLVVHGTAEERVWMAQESGFIGRPILRLLEQSFQLSRGPIEQVRLDAPGH
jgi:hypothetical protein